MVPSIKELKKICNKTSNDPLVFWNDYVYCKIAIYITKLLIYTPITANQVTLIMMGFSIVGSIFFFNGLFVTGLILMHLVVLLDSVDGEIARYRKKKTMLGLYLDNIHHVVTNSLMLFGFAYGIYNLYPNKLLIIFGFLSAISAQSIIMPAIFDTIITLKIRAIAPPPINYAKVNQVQEYEGQAKGYKSRFLKLFHSAKVIWKFPSNLMMLTALYIWEVINLKYLFIMPFITSVVFFIIYGSFVTIMQIISFIFHTKKNSVESFYAFLFGNK